MALEPIRPKDLPPSVTVYATDRIPSDDGVNVGGALPVQIVDAGAPVPSEATAIAGIDNVSRMTPFLTRAVLNDETAPSVLLAQAWAESPTPPILGSKSSKTWAEEAAGSASDAQASATAAALYDGPKVDTFAEISAVTSSDVPVGEFLRVIETGARLESVASGGSVLGAGGASFNVKPTPSGGFNVMHYGQADADTNLLMDAIADAGVGGTVIFPKTATGIYEVTTPLLFMTGQTWIGSGGSGVVNKGTQLKLVAAATSVAEPAVPGVSTTGFSAQGIYFNAQNLADCGISLYNTTYSSLTNCAANSGKAGGAGLLMDSDTSLACYFNTIAGLRAFGGGIGGAAVRLQRGANANMFIGGKYGSSTRGLEILSQSSGNTFMQIDFEDNSDTHVYLDAPNNNFIANRMENCPVGYELTANASYTTRIGTQYATSVTTTEIDNSGYGVLLENFRSGGQENSYLRFGSARFDASFSSGASILNFEPRLTLSSSNAVINLFRNTTTTGARQLNIYRGDGSSSLGFQVNAATSDVMFGDITQDDGTALGTYRKLVRRGAVPTTGTWTRGDIALARSPSIGGSIGWVCVTSGTPGTWVSFGAEIGVLPAPVVKAADFTVADTEKYLRNNKAGSTLIVTLPAAASFPGRELTISNIQAQLVQSASSNVIDIAATGTGTGILPATAGAWALLVSNGSNWVIMQRGS